MLVKILKKLGTLIGLTVAAYLFITAFIATMEWAASLPPSVGNPIAAIIVVSLIGVLVGPSLLYYHLEKRKGAKNASEKEEGLGEIQKISAEYSLGDDTISQKTFLDLLEANGFDMGYPNPGFRKSRWRRIVQNGFEVYLVETEHAGDVRRFNLGVTVRDTNSPTIDYQRAAFRAIQVVAENIAEILQGYRQQKGLIKKGEGNE